MFAYEKRVSHIIRIVTFSKNTNEFVKILFKNTTSYVNIVKMAILNRSRFGRKILMTK